MDDSAASNVERGGSMNDSVGRGDRTRNEILDVAERLFAERGFGTVSLRMITTEADVNVAAINYHFGSKERLFEAVFERRIRPLNRRRLELLALCRENGGDKPDLESVVRAFVEPYVRLAEEYGAAGAIVQQFLGRLFIEPGPDIRIYLLREFDAIWAAFSATLRAALPHLEERSVYWRFSHMMGVMYFYLAGRNWLDVRTAGVCDPSDVETTTDELVAFLVGGLSAEAPAALGGIARDRGSTGRRTRRGFDARRD